MADFWIRAAFHEAGHVIIAIHQRVSINDCRIAAVGSSTIGNNAGGGIRLSRARATVRLERFSPVESPADILRNRRYARKLIVVAFAGVAAERIACRKACKGTDLSDTALVKDVVGIFAFSPKYAFRSEELDTLRQAANRLVRQKEIEASIRTVAAELLLSRAGEISVARVRQIYKRQSLRTISNLRQNKSKAPKRPGVDLGRPPVKFRSGLRVPMRLAGHGDPK